MTKKQKKQKSQEPNYSFPQPMNNNNKKRNAYLFHCQI